MMIYTVKSDGNPVVALAATDVVEAVEITTAPWFEADLTVLQIAAVISFFVALGFGPATAHQQGKKLHLADAPQDQQVEAINYCRGVYRIVTKQGKPIEYREFDLRFKTDSSENGPKPGAADLINAGMRGDRGFVIFSSPEILTTHLKTSC